ncbi:MAG TPA: type VI secretion system Vgr family protein, partial [Burkholderiaceae bacterium]
HLPGLPANAAVSGTVTRELDGMRQQQLRFNDAPGNISVQLGTDHAATQLNIGDLSTPTNRGRTQPRGEGGEFRSDAALAVRGGQGVLISSSARPGGQGHQLDRPELTGLSEGLHAVAQELGKLAGTYRAEDTDLSRLQQLTRLLQDWHKGSNTAPDEGPGGAPVVAVSAEAGAAVVSQDNLLLGAQTHVDVASLGNTQLSAGKRLLMRCGDLFSTFGRAMRLVAAGRMDIQSDDLNIAVRTLTLNVGELAVIQANKLRLVVNGAQVDLGDGQIIQQSSGPHVIKSSSFAHTSGGHGTPAGVKLPSATLPTDEQFVLYNRQNGRPIPDRRYRAELEDGRVVEGRSDDQGRTHLTQADAAQLVDLIIHPPSH